MFQQEGLDMFRNTTIEAALAIATIVPSFALVKTLTLNPDEASSKDTFDYAFQIPDILGIPGSPNRLDFDTKNIPGTAAVPFGATLGVAETILFRNNLLDPAEQIREHTTRSLLEFDVNSIATRASGIIEATFQITGISNHFPFDPPSTAAPIQVNLRPVLEAWD